MKKVFAPGCALMLYKPELGKKVVNYLKGQGITHQELLTCCRHKPEVENGTVVINTCPGCDRRYRQLYDGISTISLWEELAESNDFPFPNYEGQVMSITDACPTRDQDRVHSAVRKLLKKMNIKLIEPENTGTKSKCCGDSSYGAIPVEQVKEQMKKRAQEMPVEDVVVYCLSCSKSMYIGGKRPRYLLDLLFGEATTPGVYEPEEWHKMIYEFIASH